MAQTEDNPKPAANACCHYCRISINRERRKKATYTKCSTCKKQYCSRCLTRPTHIGIGLEVVSEPNWRCACCLDTCCCCFANCVMDHVHCFTYKRTQSRHSLGDFKWVKAKKNYPGFDSDDLSYSCDESSGEPEVCPIRQEAATVLTRNALKRARQALSSDDSTSSKKRKRDSSADTGSSSGGEDASSESQSGSSPPVYQPQSLFSDQNFARQELFPSRAGERSIDVQISQLKSQASRVTISFNDPVGSGPSPHTNSEKKNTQTTSAPSLQVNLFHQALAAESSLEGFRTPPLETFKDSDQRQSSTAREQKAPHRAFPPVQGFISGPNPLPLPMNKKRPASWMQQDFGREFAPRKLLAKGHTRPINEKRDIRLPHVERSSILPTELPLVDTTARGKPEPRVKYPAPAASAPRPNQSKTELRSSLLPRNASSEGTKAPDFFYETKPVDLFSLSLPNYTELNHGNAYPFITSEKIRPYRIAKEKANEALLDTRECSKYPHTPQQRRTWPLQPPNAPRKSNFRTALENRELPVSPSKLLNRPRKPTEVQSSVQPQPPEDDIFVAVVVQSRPSSAYSAPAPVSSPSPLEPRDQSLKTTYPCVRPPCSPAQPAQPDQPAPRFQMDPVVLPSKEEIRTWLAKKWGTATR